MVLSSTPPSTNTILKNLIGNVLALHNLLHALASSAVHIKVGKEVPLDSSKSRVSTTLSSSLMYREGSCLAGNNNMLKLGTSERDSEIISSEIDDRLPVFEMCYDYVI
jgi:hypothetical protein